MSFKLKYNIGKTEEPSDVIKYETVDLGLPSGTLWATCNVGAKTETDYGLYFAWGETQGYTADEVGTKKNFTWSDYKFNPSGDGSTFTKYNATNKKTILDLKDDAAYVNMGEGWHMPTPAQIDELISSENTTHTVVTKSHVTGMEITSVRNSNTLFIPFAGSCSDNSVKQVGNKSVLWQRELTLRDIGAAHAIAIDVEKGFSDSDQKRYFGHTVRGVRLKKTR